MDGSLIATFAILVGLEIVLGIDNILLISILTDRLPLADRKRTRIIGLALALVARCVMLLGASYLVQLNEEVIFGLSWKAIVLITGGGFLLYKAVKEIHHVVEKTLPEGVEAAAATATVSSIITQIILLDLVFSVDSVITAVGLTDNLAVIYSSVVVSFLVVLAFSGAIASFVQKHATLKILALSFLVTIGVTLVIEGLGGHVPKGYIYMPMGFALVVEILQMRFASNMDRSKNRKP